MNSGQTKLKLSEEEFKDKAYLKKNVNLLCGQNFDISPSTSPPFFPGVL